MTVKTVEDIGLPPFSALVESHGDELLAYSRRLVDDAAEDVLQDAFIKALRAYPKLRQADHLRAWLFRITTTSAIDHANRVKGRNEVSLDGAAEPASPPPDDMFAFDGLVGGLPDSARAALVLRYVKDMPYEEMAARLGCTAQAARQRVSTAVRALRERFT